MYIMYDIFTINNNGTIEIHRNLSKEFLDLAQRHATEANETP